MRKSAGLLLSLLVLASVAAAGGPGTPLAAPSEPGPLAAVLDQCLAAGRAASNNETLSLVAVGLVRTGQLERAAALLPAITDWHQLRPTQELAAAYARLGQHDQASAVLEQISPKRRAESLVVVAAAYAGSGQRDEALRVLAELKESELAGYEWTDVARIYHQLGLSDDAHEAINNALLKGSTYSLHFPSWSKTVSTLDAIGERDYALQVLDNLQALARKEKDRDRREGSLEKIAAAYARFGRSRQALRIAGSLFSAKSITTREVGEALAEAGDVEGARQAAAQLETPEYKVDVLAAIARALFKADHREEGLAPLAEASRLSEQRPPELTAVALSLAWAAAGDAAKTREAMAKLQETDQLNTMLAVATEFSALGMTGEENHWQEQAEELATNQGAWYLAQVVQAYARQGRCDQAVRVVASTSGQCGLLLGPVVDHCAAPEPLKPSGGKSH